MANYRDYEVNGRMYREIIYGDGKRIRVPLGGGGLSDPTIGIGKAESLYGRTPGISSPASSPSMSGVYGLGPGMGAGGAGLSGMNRLPQPTLKSQSVAPNPFASRVAGGLIGAGPMALSLLVSDPQTLTEVSFGSSLLWAGAAGANRLGSKFIKSAAESGMLSRWGVSYNDAAQATMRNGAPFRPIPRLSVGGALGLVYSATEVGNAVSADTNRSIGGITALSGLASAQYAASAIAPQLGGLLGRGALGTALGVGASLGTGFGAFALGSTAAGMALRENQNYVGNPSASIAMANANLSNFSQSSGLGARFNQPLNLFQRLASPASVFIDSVFQLPGVVNYPAKLTGLPTQIDVSKAFKQYQQELELSSGFAANQTIGQSASQLLRFSRGGSDAVASFSDAINRYGGEAGVSGGIQQSINAAIKNLTSSMPNNIRYQSEAALTYEAYTTLAKTQQTYAGNLNQRAAALRQGVAANVVPSRAQVQARTTELAKTNSLVAAGLPALSRLQNRGASAVGIGDLISLGVNKVVSFAKGIFSGGEIAETERRAAEAKNIAQGYRNRAAVPAARYGAANLTRIAQGLYSGQAPAAQGGGGGRTYQRINYAAQNEARYQARQAQMNAERAFGAGTRLIGQKFSELIAGFEPFETQTESFDYRSVNAAVEGFLPGEVTSSQYKQAYTDAYQKQLDIQRTSLAADRAAGSQRITDIRAAQSAFTGLLAQRSKGVPSGSALGIDIQTAQSRISTDASREINKVVATLGRLDKQFTKLESHLDENRENSFASFVAGTARVARSEAGYLARQSLSADVDVIRDQKFTLEKDRQLGLVSSSNFLRRQAELDRAELGKERAFYDLDVAARLPLVRNQLATLRDGGHFDEANTYQQAFQNYQASNEAKFAQRTLDLSDEEVNRKIRFLNKQEFSQGFQPYFNSLFKAATAGKNPIGSIGSTAASQLSSLGGNAISGFLFDKIPAIEQLFQGGTQQIPTNLSKALGGYVAPNTLPAMNQWRSKFQLAGFSNPQQAQKTIGAGTLGYATSQAIANRMSPYNNGALGAVGSATGGLIGSAFGPTGAFVGSTLGGTIGAIPQTQSALGGGIAGALSGAGAGFMLGGPIGGLIGAGLGGLLGAFGGSQSSALRKQQEQAAKAQSYAQRQQAKDFGKSILAQGIPYASDLFDGYGDYNQKMDALMAQINPARMNSAAVAQGLTGDALRTANQAFAASRSAYNPILALAEANKSVISRPGAFQGAMYDYGLRDQSKVLSSGPYASGPISQLYGQFNSIQQNLGQYGFDQQRASLAYDVFAKQYQNQGQALDYDINIAQRDFGTLLEQNRLGRVDRGIQGDILNRSVANFDRDSQKQIESALGTLQRRENRAGIVADLREDQAFNKDILLRKQSLFNDQSALSNRQDQYQQADVLKNIDDLVQSRQALTAGFGDFSTRITNASDEFYTLSESVKEVNRQLELLSRNLR